MGFSNKNVPSYTPEFNVTGILVDNSIIVALSDSVYSTSDTKYNSLLFNVGAKFLYSFDGSPAFTVTIDPLYGI